MLKLGSQRPSRRQPGHAVWGRQPVAKQSGWVGVVREGGGRGGGGVGERIVDGERG